MEAMTIRRGLAALIAGLCCGLMGWCFGRVGAPRTDASAAASAEPAPHTLFAPGPSVALDADGLVTIAVDHKPLKWVLAEIDRQAGTRVAASAESEALASSGVEPREPISREANVAQADEIVAHVMRGSEPQRFETLVQAQNSGALSEDMLKTLYTTDASPRVRLLAFAQAQEGTEADPAARRAALEAARLLPDAVVSQEAARLLEALDVHAARAAPQVATTR